MARGSWAFFGILFGQVAKRGKTEGISSEKATDVTRQLDARAFVRPPPGKTPSRGLVLPEVRGSIETRRACGEEISYSSMHSSSNPRIESLSAELENVSLVPPQI